MDLVIFEKNMPFVLKALRSGDFDCTETASEVFETDFFRFIKSITPPQADGVCKGIILSLPPHPRERELAETPPQADGVLKTLINPKFTF